MLLLSNDDCILLRATGQLALTTRYIHQMKKKPIRYNPNKSPHKSLKNQISIILGCSSMILFLFLAIFSLVRPDKSYSFEENRSLEQYKTPSESAVLNGEWEETYESYSLDQFVLRKQILREYFKLMDRCGVRERNDLVHGKNDTILTINEQVSDYTSKQSLKRYAKRRIEAMQILDKVCRENGAHLISLQIPNRSNFFAENYPALYREGIMDSTNKMEYLTEKLQKTGIAVVNTSNTIENHKDEYLFFHTDNHYTYLGAYYVYHELLEFINEQYQEELSFPEWDDCEYVRESARFAGNYLKKFGDSGEINNDYLEYIIPYEMPEYRRFEDGVESDLPVFDTKNTTYEMFMSGNNANTAILTDRPELPSVLWIGYSYTNALEAMSIYTFNEVHSIDMRHFVGNISDYIQKHDFKYVIVVRNDLYEGNTENRAKI